jgi:hypothetical protein
MRMLTDPRELSKNPFVRQATLNLLRLLPRLESKHHARIYEPLPPTVFTRQRAGVISGKELKALIDEALDYYYPPMSKVANDTHAESGVYVLSVGSGKYKVGASTNLLVRLRSHDQLSINGRRPIKIIPADDPFRLELHLHHALAQWRHGRRELFSLPPLALKWLRSISVTGNELPIPPWA